MKSLGDNIDNDKYWNDCAITGKTGVVDDCSVTIEFGYGSDRDFMKYTFTPVHHDTGVRILNYIQTLMPSGNKVKFHGKNTLTDNT
jgi:hypothetical protein